MHTLNRTLLLLLLAAPQVAAAGDAIVSLLEEPTPGSAYTGVSSVRGWAVALAGVDRVELSVDGVPAGNIPMGGSRPDIRDAFRAYPNAAQAGFSMAFNYSSLPAGPHTFAVRVIDANGTSRTSTARFFVVRFDNPFIRNPEALSLADAKVVIGGAHQLNISNLTADGASYDVILEWRPAIQGFAITRIIPAGVRANPEPVLAPRKGAPEWLGARCQGYPDRALCEALGHYVNGRLNEAARLLQRLLAGQDTASVHAPAEALLRDIHAAGMLYSSGSASAANGRLAEADATFQRALALDAALVLGPEWSGSDVQRARALEVRESFVRRAVRELMVSQSYVLAKELNDRRDFRHGCRLVKLGMTYSAENSDLVRLGYDCSVHAQRMLRPATTCNALQAVVEVAMPRDETLEVAQAKLRELGCPSR